MVSIQKVYIPNAVKRGGPGWKPQMLETFGDAVTGIVYDPKAPRFASKEEAIRWQSQRWTEDTEFNLEADGGPFIRTTGRVSYP
jgi:hypothetical protein